MPSALPAFCDQISWSLSAAGDAVVAAEQPDHPVAPEHAAIERLDEGDVGIDVDQRVLAHMRRNGDAPELLDMPAAQRLGPRLSQMRRLNKLSGSL